MYLLKMVISHCYIYIIIYVSLPEGNNQQIEIYHELSSNHGKKCDNMEVETGIHSVCSVSGYSFESLVVKLAKQRHVYISVIFIHHGRRQAILERVLEKSQL